MLIRVNQEIDIESIDGGFHHLNVSLRHDSNIRYLHFRCGVTDFRVSDNKLNVSNNCGSGCLSVDLRSRP
jgi:hypothetical protein